MYGKSKEKLNPIQKIAIRDSVMKNGRGEQSRLANELGVSKTTISRAVKQGGRRND
jgi:uncharacterized membrane protein